MPDEVSVSDKLAALGKAKDVGKAEQSAITAQPSMFSNISLTQVAKEAPLDLCVEIIRKTYVVKAKEGNRYLTAEQAAAAALFGYEELGSPFAILKNMMWLNPDTGRIAMTVEGKLFKARRDGFNFKTPQFKRLPEEVDKPLVAIQCTLPVEGGEPVVYVARLDEWKMDSNPNWKSRPEWMLTIRSLDKAIGLARGFGVSEEVAEPQPLSFSSPEVKSIAPKQYSHPQLPQSIQTVDAELVEAVPSKSHKEKK